jgi:hypothetical protein
MPSSFHHSQKRKAVAAAAFIGCALAPLFCQLTGVTAQACSILSRSEWVLAALRPILLPAICQTESMHLLHNAGLLSRVLEIAPFLWPLLGPLAGHLLK